MKIIINGINGVMGRIVLGEAENLEGAEVVAGFDTKPAAPGDGPVFRGKALDVFGSPNPVPGGADVLIDFSHFSSIPALMDYCAGAGLPGVICTTGLGEDEMASVAQAARKIPVFRSANMSLGINLMAKMGAMAAPALEDRFNVEIIEKHHTRKKDSPSGTALLLADAVNGACAGKKDYLFGRHGKNDECRITDLGIHAIRGGSIPGQHTILFAGPDETIEITHTVYSRKVFALGALKAALFICGRKPGLYSMEDML